MGNNRQEQIKNAFEEMVGKGNLDIVEEALAEGYIAHAGEKEFCGHASIKESAVQFRSGMPDLHIVEVKFLAQDADNVVWQRTLEGTHEGDIQGIPASGKKVKWVDMVVTRFEDEKIAEEWVVSELMGELLLKASQT